MARRFYGRAQDFVKNFGCEIQFQWRRSELHVVLLDEITNSARDSQSIDYRR